MNTNLRPTNVGVKNGAMSYRVENTTFIGKEIYDFDHLPSTNDYALDLISKSSPSEGSLVITDYQTLGRGQIGSVWSSDAGQNLLFSIVLYPDFLKPEQQFNLTIVVSLALVDVLTDLGVEGVSIKWPNDIYIGKKKVAGILIQNALQGKALTSSVVGVGLNVNQCDWPDHLPNPTSIAAVLGKAIDLTKLLQQYCQQLEQGYTMLRSGFLSGLKRRYLQALLGYQTTMPYTLDGRAITGRIEGVGEEGHLLLSYEGRLDRFAFKEISLDLSQL